MGRPAPIPRRSSHLGSAACHGRSDPGSHSSTSAASSRSNRRQENHNRFQTLKMFPDGHLEGGGKAGGKVKLPLVGEGGAEANAKAGLAGTSEVSSKFGRHGIDQVVREIGGSSFTIFIDDY